MTRADDSGPLRALVEVMEAAGCLLDDFDSGGEKSGMKSRLRGGKYMSSYFASRLGTRFIDSTLFAGFSSFGS